MKNLTRYDKPNYYADCGGDDTVVYQQFLAHGCEDQEHLECRGCCLCNPLAVISVRDSSPHR